MGFPSTDSQITDVDSEPFDVNEGNHHLGLGLKAVEEEEEEDGHDDKMSDEENGLAGYEDEEDSDTSFQSPGGSSFGSIDELPRSVSHLIADTNVSTSTFPPLQDPIASPRYPPHASLSKGWTFPKGSQVAPSTPREPEEVDRFFGCLDDIDLSPPLRAVAHTYEASKGLFSQGFKFGSDTSDEDDLPPFLLPCNVGLGAVDKKQSVLQVVTEEEEEEADEDEDTEATDVEEFEEGTELEIGEIKIIFTPPETAEVGSTEVSLPSPLKKPACEPFEDEVEDEDEVLPLFNFGRTQSTSDTKHSSRPTNRGFASPSSIPRATSLKASSSSTAHVLTSTPPKPTADRYSLPGYTPNSFVTPPTKRGGVMPSFIPQPVSPLRTVVPTEQTVIPAPTYIPQPQSKPAARNSGNKVLPTVANGSTFKPQPVASTPTYSSHVPQPPYQRTFPPDLLKSQRQRYQVCLQK
jgi:hypothetical protein